MYEGGLGITKAIMTFIHSVSFLSTYFIEGSLEFSYIKTLRHKCR